MNASAKPEPIVIKKYANRRLYDTETSAYITLDDMCERVKEGREFIVVDAKTGQDLTRQVLAQIILESELKGHPLLSTDFLRSVIGFYDDKMQGVLQHYLNASMKAFITNQDKMRGVMNKAAATSGFSPFGQFEEMTRQNVALFEKAIGMFSPFSMFSEGQQAEEQPAASARKQRRS
jgi:polyhydroxyalkanoate synthesis repressor PhaR